MFRSDWYQIHLSFQNLALTFFDFSTSCCCFNSIDHCSIFKLYFYKYLCGGVMVLACQYLWGWKENLEELVLGLVGKHLLSTSHLTCTRTWTSIFLFFFWQIFFDLSNFLKYQHGVSDSVSLVCSSMYSITFLCPIMLIRWIFIFGLFKKYFNFFGELIFLFMCYLQVCCWISKYLMQIQLSLLLICSFNTTVGWEHILNNAIFHICYIVFDDPECVLSS